MATNHGASPTTMNAGNPSPQWAGGFGASDTAKTSPGGAQSARSCSCRNDLGCGCRSAADRRIGWWRQSTPCRSLQRPSPWCPSSCGVPRWLCRRGVNKSSRCRGGDGCGVQLRVGLLPCLFSLVQSIYLRHWLLHVSWGFWIAHGVFYSIHRIMGHRACRIIATPGV